jgi:hypothetical protein
MIVMAAATSSGGSGKRVKSYGLEAAVSTRKRAGYSSNGQVRPDAVFRSHPYCRLRFAFADSKIKILHS